MEFLVSEPAQSLYAQANYEYPVRRNVPLDPIIGETIGELKVDTLPLTQDRGAPQRSQHAGRQGRLRPVNASAAGVWRALLARRPHGRLAHARGPARRRPGLAGWPRH